MENEKIQDVKQSKQENVVIPDSDKGLNVEDKETALVEKKFENVVQGKKPNDDNNIVNNQDKDRPVVVQVVPKKQKSNCCCGCLIGILIIVSIVIGGLFFVIHKVSDGIKKGPKDLGVRYSMKDYDSFVRKLGSNFSTSPETLCFICPVRYEGTRSVKTKFSNEEISAWFEYANSKANIIKDTQIKFSKNEIELTTNFTYDAKTMPIALVGNIQKVDQKSVAVYLKSLSIGSFKMPYQMLPNELSSSLTDFVNGKLEEIEGLKIYTLNYGDNYLNFEGSIPAYIEGYVPDLSEFDGSGITSPSLE